MAAAAVADGGRRIATELSPGASFLANCSGMLFMKMTR